MAGEGDFRKDPRPGDPIRSYLTARYLSWLNAAARYVDELRGNSGGGGNKTTIKPPAPSTDTVLVKNNSGSNVAQFGVLGISGPLMDYATNSGAALEQVALSGVAPTTSGTNLTGKFVVAAEPIAAGNIGRAIGSGFVSVQVNFANAGDPFADIKNNDTTQLSSGSSGAAQIISNVGGSTGKQWAIVRLGPAAGTPGFWAKITGNSQNGSNFRWGYAWSQVAKTAAGFGTSAWTVVSGGLSGTTSSHTAYCVTETINGASGLFGNGTNSSNFPSGGSVQPKPCPNGNIVWMRANPATGEYLFEYPNSNDGPCT